MEVLLWLLGYSVTLAVGIAISLKIKRRMQVSRKAPAPALSSRWKCQHPDLIDVESGSEVVAYICKECDEQVDFDSPAATRHRVRQKVDLGYYDMGQDLLGLKPTVDGYGRQTEDQAKRFAERTQRFDKGGHIPGGTIVANSVVADQLYIPVEPNLSEFRSNLDKDRRTAAKKRDRAKQEALRVKRAPKMGGKYYGTNKDFWL